MSMDISRWNDFFVAEAGAAAALAGLLFVAVSINLSRVLAYEHLPRRASESLTLVLAVLVIATLGLIPGTGATSFAIELCAVGAVLWSSQVVSLRRTLPQDRKYGSVLVRTLVNQFPPLSFIATGALTLVDPRCLPLVSVAVLACFASGVHGAWVLLIEILR